MIYSKFGSKLTPISKQEDDCGKVMVQANVEGGADVREYHVADLKADAGPAEIDKMVAALPWKVVEKKVMPRQQGYR